MDTETFIESIETLTINKLRTGLAMLGIVIGIGSVITLISIGQATSQQVQNQIQSLGANLLTVNPGFQTTGAVRGAAGGGTTLTLADAKAISTDPSITTITTVSPEYSSRTQATTERTNSNVQIIGATPTYLTVHKLMIDQGSFLTDRDVANMRKIAVLGPQVVSDLFGNSVSPIGQTIRLEGQTFTIIGITTSKGGTGFFNQDNVVFVPLTTAQKQLFGRDYLSSIALEAKSSEVMTEAQNQVGFLLLARHKLSDPQDADFSIFSQADILSAASTTTGTFTTLLAGIAAISLLVGGIGIMNIMLVTVTERTREIGLRKALGARRQTIITQFLTEAVILTIIGGLLGIMIGVIASFIISQLTQSLFIISLPAILLAIGVSGGIGILFGWYPARRASRMEPIEALRYE